MFTEDRAGRSTLVVDDDEVMRELLCALLEAEGYLVSVAESGEAALDRLRQPARPAIILTDLQMPGLEGEALTRALRALAPAETVLLGMSGRTPSEAVLLTLDAFIPKPFEIQQLEEAIAEARTARRLQTHASLAASTDPASEPEAPAGEPPLDEGIFAAMAKTFRPPQLGELYTMTLNDVLERHSRIAASAAEADLPAVQREAHAIKGACGMVGARELQGLAAAVEGGTKLNTSAIAEIPRACDRLRRILDAKLQQKW